VKLPLRVKGDPWLYVVTRLILTTAVRLYGRFDCCGVENLPAGGPAIIVSNHHSDVDPIFLCAVMPRTLHFLGDVVQFRRPFVGPIIKRLGAIPINKGRPDRQGLERALELLRRGEVVVLFPEGDLFRQTEVEPFGRGVAFLALRGSAPIIPVGISGAEGIYSQGRVRRVPVQVVIGAPVDVGGLTGRGAGAYAEIAARVHGAVVGLSEGVCGHPMRKTGSA
jgi:1-acyl-sn-glycerol-3-phosphate acyltransferase